MFKYYWDEVADTAVRFAQRLGEPDVKTVTGFLSVTDPSRFSRPEQVLFLSSSSSILLTSVSGPHSRPTTSQKILVALGFEHLWICSQ
jgi:hypothetical protein